MDGQMLRRGFLALVLGGAAMLAACGEQAAQPQGGSAANGAAETPVSPSTRTNAELHRGNGAEPDTVDPQKASGSWENNIIGDMFLGLTTEDADGKAIPGAAESWTISDDGKTFTFTLRDHKWSDGTPVTAGDFVFAYRRILEPKFPGQYKSNLYTFKNAQAVAEGKMPPEQLGVRAVDDRTLVIETENPAPYIFELLTHYSTYPVPQHLVQRVGDSWTQAGTMVTNGPYVLDEWRPNDFIRLVKNPQFYDAASVAIEQVYFYPTDDQNAAIKRFRAGELDLQRGFPSTQLEFLQQNLSAETRIAPFIVTQFVVFNTQRAPFTDARIRNALAMAIDRETLTAKVLRAGERPAYNLIPHEIMNYKPGAMPAWKELAYEQRLQRAKELLAEAGYGPGNPLRFQYSATNTVDARRVATAFQDMWRQIGVEAEIASTEPKVLYNNLRAGNFEVSWAGWIADYSDPKNYLFLAQKSSGEMNYPKWQNDAYDALVQQANGIRDVAARADVVQKAEQMLLDEQPLAPFLFGTSRTLVQTWVKGYRDNPTAIQRTRWMSVERPQSQATQ